MIYTLMRHLKLFEDYKSSEDVEDILLTFIDDGLCNMVGNEYFKSFIFKNTKDFNLAENRLKSYNVNNYLKKDLIICFFSEELEKYVENEIHNMNWKGANVFWSNLTVKFNMDFSDIFLFLSLTKHKLKIPR